MAKKRAQKKPPERWSPRGTKDTNLFRERLDESPSCGALLNADDGSCWAGVRDAD